VSYQTTTNTCSDLTHVSTVIQLSSAAQKQLRESNEIATLAAMELRDREMALVGAVEDAEEAESISLALSKTVREVIRRRVVAERLLGGLLKRVSVTRRRANAMLPSRSDAAREVHSMHYRQHGVIVPTPYGMCKVAEMKYILIHMCVHIYVKSSFFLSSDE
jgi:hypothetical protein